jgi:large subunit ribosomal protein L34
MKRTWQPNKLKEKKTSGFLARKLTKVLKTRRAKGRKRLSK